MQLYIANKIDDKFPSLDSEKNKTSAKCIISLINDDDFIAHAIYR